MNIVSKSCYFLTLALISSCNPKESQNRKAPENNPIVNHSNNLEELDGFMNLASDDLYLEIGYLPFLEIPGRIVYCPGPGTFKLVE